ncbi:MAG: hypothetical protein WBA74_21055 [Cyclobacteriaceae bacterium]
MKHLILSTLSVLLLFGSPIRSYAGNTEDVHILSAILTIEAVQDLLVNEKSPINSNGLIDEEITIYINDNELKIEDLSTDKKRYDHFSVVKFKVEKDEATVVFKKDKIKVKVFLNIEDEEWNVRHYFVVDAHEIAAGITF